MKQNVISILICLVLMFVLSISAVTVMATGEEGGETTSSESSSVDSSSDESDDTSSDDQTSSDDETSSGDETSSDEEMSSEEETSSEEGTTSEESSSESGTTSKPGASSAKPGGGNTFIDETGSNVSLPNNIGTDVEEGQEDSLYGEEEGMGVDEEIEHYNGGKVVAMSSLVYRYIWIPILVAVLCVAALVYVNIAFRMKFASNNSNVGRRSNPKRSTSSGAKRRNVK